MTLRTDFQKEHGLGTLVAEIGARSTEVDEVWLCSVLPLQELNVPNYQLHIQKRQRNVEDL